MVHIGNSWDDVLKGEFDKDYYLKLAGVSQAGIWQPNDLSQYVRYFQCVEVYAV